MIVLQRDKSYFLKKAQNHQNNDIFINFILHKLGIL